jgi:GT2 family glycosyltransferase
VFNYDNFKRLLSLDLNIVSGIYRAASGVICSGYMDNGSPKTIRDIKEIAPFEVDFTGFGFTLIKKGVFEKMEAPFFIKENGKEKYYIDDIAFGIKAKEAGFKIMLDPLTIVGHEKKLVI